MNEKNIRELLSKLYNSEYGIFFAYIFSGMKIEVSNEVPYAGITPEKLTINPKLFNMEPKQVFYILAHECLHIYFQHFTRFKEELKKNSILVNIATDLAINSILGKIDLPILFPDQFNFPELLTAEEYYALLRKYIKDRKGKGKGKNGGFQDDKSKQGKNGGFQDDKKTGGKEGKETDDKDINDQIKKWIDKLIDYIEDYEDLEKNEDELNDLMRKIRHGLEKVGEGRIIKSLEADAKRLWEILINKWLGSIRKYKYLTYRREHRRAYEHSDFFIPYQAKRKVLNIAVFIDASGSIDENLLSYYTSIIKKNNPDVEFSVVASFDTNLYFYKDIKKVDTIYGGGGTDFRPIFDYCSKNKTKIDGILIFTDGYGEYPNEFPKIPTAWFTTTTGSEEYIIKNVPSSHMVICFSRNE